MSLKNKIFIANWKMQKTITQSLQFIQDNLKDLKSLNNKIIICPSFTDLYPISHLLRETSIYLGAQNCSSFTHGAYTGQISAQMLAELDCQYCIIGHSESRLYFKESNKQIAQKCIQLLSANITPIVCIGESEKDFKKNRSLEILKKQVSAILQAVKKMNSTQPKTIYFAYEPMWAIGTNTIPKADYLMSIFDHIAAWCSASNSHLSYQFIYGGSVNETTLPTLNNIKQIHGFLVGSASLDFKKFKNLVSYK